MEADRGGNVNPAARASTKPGLYRTCGLKGKAIFLVEACYVRNMQMFQPFVLLVSEAVLCCHKNKKVPFIMYVHFTFLS